jgi:RNA polymerase sigma factor (sigma-70 family)
MNEATSTKPFNPKTKQVINLTPEETKKFNALFDKHYSEILNYIKFKITSVEDAEEITMDTFLKACRYLNSYAETKSKISTWLRNIANTCISDHFRVDHSDNEIPTSDFVNAESGKETFQYVADEETNDYAENNELGSRISVALGNLKPKYRKIAILCFVEEREYKEIAEICEIPMGTVQGMVSRCRKMLQSELQRAKREYAIA